MRIAGSIPDDQEKRMELMSIAKIFIVGQKIQRLSQEYKIKIRGTKHELASRRKNENNNEKKNK